MNADGEPETLSGPDARPLLLFVVNWDWFFLSHRLPLAVAAQAAGYRVAVAAVDTGQADRIRGAGLDFMPLHLSPHGTNPIRELRSLLELRSLYRRVRPAVIHHVTIKPVLYGSLAARTAVPTAGVVNAISGLGTMFAESARAKLMRLFINPMYRAALRHDRARTIFQNPEDRHRFVSAGIVEAERTFLIRGSGVDCVWFQPAPEPDGPPLVIMAARLLWEKGVGEFVEAARIIRGTRPDVRFAIIGSPDDGNARSVPQEQLDAWRADGVVEVWGFRTDMSTLLAQAHVVTLPTYYREGVPKFLLEAAAAGKPIVTTDWAGCREVVQHGKTGLLVPPRDPRSLADAIARLIDEPQLRARLGSAARAQAVREFSIEGVVTATLSLYTELQQARRA